MATKKKVQPVETAAKTARQHRQFAGVVVAKSGEKTVSVLVKMTKMHPKYRKQYIVTQKYAVHDEGNTASVGDAVTFEECRPLSARKRWRLVTTKA